MKNSFDKFKVYFKHYQDKFGLANYDVKFYNKDLKDSIAEIIIDYSACIAEVSCSTKHKFKNVDQIRKTALHECVHLLLGELSYYARARFVIPENLGIAEEKICTLLEGIIQ